MSSVWPVSRGVSFGREEGVEFTALQRKTTSVGTPWEMQEVPLPNCTSQGKQTGLGGKLRSSNMDLLVC